MSPDLTYSFPDSSNLRPPLQGSLAEEAVEFINSQEESSGVQAGPSGKTPASGQGVGTPQEARLDALKSKVADKKDEFDKVATSPEERLDRQRAHERMDYLHEIGKNILNYHPELFDRYMQEIAEPVLGYEARSLNFILASRSFRFARRFSEAYDKEHWVLKNLVENEIKLAISRKKDWDRKYYYLPGLPIVVEDTDLSVETKAALSNAAALITKMEWLEKRPEILRYVESIVLFEEERDYGAWGAIPGHPYIDAKNSGLEMAEVIIHEATHYFIRDKWSEIYDPNLKADITSYFVDDGKTPCSTSELLGELYAYARGIEFVLALWETAGFDAGKDYNLRALEYYCDYVPRVKQEFEVLQKKDHKAIEGYLIIVYNLWSDLIPRIEGFRKKEVFRRILGDIKTARGSITKIIHERTAKNITSKDVALMPRFRILDITSRLKPIGLSTDLKEVDSLVKAMMALNSSIDKLEDNSPAQAVEILDSVTLRAFNAVFDRIRGLNSSIDELEEFGFEDLSFLEKLSRAQKDLDTSI